MLRGFLDEVWVRAVLHRHGRLEDVSTALVQRGQVLQRWKESARLRERHLVGEVEDTVQKKNDVIVNEDIPLDYVFSFVASPTYISNSFDQPPANSITRTYL